MPRGTDPLTVLRAAREFAKAEFSDHRYVMVLHDHQANPHVHLSVRTESNHGDRLNRGRQTYNAGARHSRKGCAVGESMRRLRDRRRAASGTATSRYGG
jgi:hypothetical protein